MTDPTDHVGPHDGNTFDPFHEEEEQFWIEERVSTQIRAMEERIKQLRDQLGKRTVISLPEHMIEVVRAQTQDSIDDLEKEIKELKAARK